VAELPSGTVTFLLTDLESSTRLWEELPEAMTDALTRHDEILRDAVDARTSEVQHEESVVGRERGEIGTLARPVGGLRDMRRSSVTARCGYLSAES
jgi:hypothetical protein